MIIAAADVGNEGADWGWLGFCVRRSLDGGEHWTEGKKTQLFVQSCQKSLLALPVDEGTEKNFPWRYPEGMQKGRQYVLCSYPSGENNREDIRRTDGTISLGEVGEDCQITWKAHKKIRLEGTWKTAEDPIFTNFFPIPACASRKTEASACCTKRCPTTACAIHSLIWTGCWKSEDKFSGLFYNGF